MKVFGVWSEDLEYWYRQVIFGLMIATVTLTLVSGLSYLWRNRRIVFNGR